MKSKTAEDKSQLDMFECNTNPAVSDQEPPANNDSERNPTSGDSAPDPPEPPTPAPPSAPAANDDAEDQLPPGKVWIFRKYITRNGKRIARPDGKMWRFPGDPDYNPSK